jgi:precorrin-2 dehydrogenase/sirohydrochlorin ferrochelatase
MDCPENPYHPIFIDLMNKLVVIVGGGMVAARKMEPLLKAGARVKIISPEVVDEIGLCAQAEIVRREYKKDDLKGASLVIAATHSEETNRAVSEDALAKRIFCNVVDSPELCTFIVPSVVERGPIKIAISTGGVSPALSKRLRMIIGNSIGEEYVILAAILGKIRPFVRSSKGGAEDHRRLFEVLINSELLDAIRAQDRTLAEDILFQALGEHFDLKGIIP